MSNILVKCLEDLQIKLKPAEVSCKSCCALLGAHVMYRVWVTVKYSSWETQECSVLLTSLGLGRSLTCSWQLLLCLWKVTPGSLPRAGMLLCLPGCACSTTGMGACTLSGSRQSLACLSFSSSTGAAVPRRCNVRVCCGTSCWSFPFRTARAWIP